MKNFVAIILALVLLPVAQVQAWIGGPFSGGKSYTPGGDDGIYEAIATTTDGLGMYRWAVQNSSTVAAGNALTFSGQFGTSNVTFGGLATAKSSHVWYYRGVTYHGICIGSVNSGLNRVSCIGNASDSGLDGAGVIINSVSLVGGTSGDEDLDGTNNTGAFGDNVGVLGVGSADRKSFCNSSFVGTFDADKSDYVPVRRFSAKGEITFFGAPDQRYFLIDTSAGGFNPPGDFAVVDVSFGGNDDKFEREGHRRTINVFGSRVSASATGTVSSGN